MTVEEALNRKTDRVKLPDWIQIPEGCVPRLAEIEWTQYSNGYSRGSGYVTWRIVAPFWRWGSWESFTEGRWFDLKDLELVEEEKGE